MFDPERLDGLAAACSVLGRFHLAPPDEQAMRTLWELLDEWPLPAEGHTLAGLDELRATRDLPESHHAIRADHSAVYGTAAVAKVAPYESVHRGMDGLVFDEQTLEVREAYRALALEAPNLNREPDDHIGLEFDFMAQCCLRILDALDGSDLPEAGRVGDMAAGFLRDHLLRWAPQMLRQVVEVAGTHWMRGVALLSLGALAELEVDLVG